MTIDDSRKRRAEDTAADERGAAADGRRLRSDEETRAIILEAARHEFPHSGYAATSMESVARRAGVSTKTLYRLIPNKAALFEAMVTERHRPFRFGRATARLRRRRHRGGARARRCWFAPS